MPQINFIRFQCAKCKRFNYWSRKNIKKVERKLTYSKFCKWCKAHTSHKEAKKT
ncbi:MAG: 50S ribosomal protein L33 [Candidatus Sungbacteria bacterium]|nr:50S ribosomal protein L33 [Candidatus Sungbacteria bacterium]